MNVLLGNHLLVRLLLLGCASLLAAGAPVSAQEWAKKMFATTKHDFGTVARGAKAQFRFQLQNLYEEDVHIKDVKSTCGCTKPVVLKADLKRLEYGEILAEFNTRDYMGYKSATITIVFDKPFYAEVQLQVSGFIRSDVVLQPGEVNFGTVDAGSEAQKQVEVTYAGREDWGIEAVKIAEDSHLDCQLVERSRGGGRVVYDLVARLEKTAPVGYLKQQITLVTNDAQNPEILVDVEGRVASEITISPGSLFMGVVQPGQQLKKTLIVRGKRPFKIVDVKCNDASFDITAGADAKVIHVLPVVFTAGSRSGKITQEIGIQTDQGSTPTFVAYAQVVGTEEPKLAKP